MNSYFNLINPIEIKVYHWHDVKMELCKILNINYSDFGDYVSPNDPTNTVHDLHQFVIDYIFPEDFEFSPRSGVVRTPVDGIANWDSAVTLFKMTVEQELNDLETSNMGVLDLRRAWATLCHRLNTANNKIYIVAPQQDTEE